MTTLPVAITRHHTADDLQWLSPAPLWQAADVGRAASGLTQPWIAELRTDSFVDEFLDTLAGIGGRSPAALGDMQPAVTVDGTGHATSAAAYRLFQPLSRRYYLVTASLTCRRPGIPDHRLSPAENDRVFFVMRQIDTAGAERGFVGGQWLPASPSAVLPGEQEHPMHPAPVTSFAEPGTAAANLGMASGSPSTRSVFYGYIPVTSRDSLVPPIADPGAVLKELQASMPQPDPAEHPAIDELMGRVVGTWQQLRDSQTSIELPLKSPKVEYPSLFLLLDLLDWQRIHLPDIFDAITDSNVTLPSGSAAQALLTALDGVTIVTTNPSDTITLTEALAAVEDFLPLVQGADMAGPRKGYDLANATIPATWLKSAKRPGVQDPPSLASLALAALNEVGEEYQVPPELQGLIKADPVAEAGTGQVGRNQAYVIRAVLSHEPCRPILSGPTRAFELARALDADAPARPVLLQLPDINNLRKFDRGVAIEMPPSLRQMLDRVTPDILKDKGLLGPPGLQLGMICSFSLQIIFLVAFIVMFIFLILLNIVFWWLPFLKICFPVPVLPRTPKGPTP